MALDPRISLAAQVPDISNLFTNFRDSLERTKAIERNDAAAPFQQQLLEQQAASGAAQATDERSQRRLSNLYQTGQQLKPFLDRGDTQGAQNFMLNNISRLQGRIEAGEDIDVTESMETLQKLQQGDVQGVQGDIAAVNGLFNQQAGRGQTASQREMQGNLRIAQDPNSTQLEKDSALRSLGAMANVKTTAAERTAQNQVLGQQVVEQITAEEQAKSDVSVASAGKKEAIKAGVKQAEKAFEKMSLVRTAIGNYDDAIAAIDAGADTGTITRLLPSLSTAGKTLDNTIKKLGLDVVGNTTFGALSESELAFALQAAIPDNLEPQELRKWLSAKKNAQQKILAGLDEVSTFLGDGTKTISDWKSKQLVDKLSSEEVVNAPQVTSATNALAPATTPRAGGVIMTDAEGNRATVYPDGTFEEL